MTVGLILINIIVFLAVEFTGSSQNTMHMLDCGAAYTPMIIEGGNITDCLPVCSCISESNTF